MDDLLIAEEWRPPASTSEALMRVMRSADAVEKETRKGINYAFRTIDGLYANLHDHLAREGVIIRIDTDFLDFDTTGTIGSNVNTTRITARCTAVATSPWDDKEVTLGSGIFLGQDSSDKGPGKLHSYAYKTIVSSAFSIPIAGDDVEADREQTGHGWYGWETKADHDRERTDLYGRLRALPEEFRAVAVDSLKKQRVIGDDGHLLSRLSPAKMDKLGDEVVTAESAAAGAEPFDVPGSPDSGPGSPESDANNDSEGSEVDQ